MIFMALNFVLENYFKDVLFLVDQSSDICDKILDCWFLSFNIFFLWIIQIKQTFIAYDFGALQYSYLYINVVFKARLKGLVFLSLKEPYTVLKTRPIG